MAFRFGHQITCNIKRNTFFRSSSADSSSRHKSPPSTFKRILNGNSVPLHNGKRINLLRTRSLPSPENDTSLFSRKFSSKKPPDQESESSGTLSYVRPKPIILEDTKMTNTGLQPSQLSPIDVHHIPQTSTSVPESARKAQIEKLKRFAYSQYQKAVKSMNQQSEEQTYRYQLESARPTVNKGGKIYNVHQILRKTRREIEKTPQLQPRNIKPYGKIETIPWCAPNVRYRKGNITQKQKADNRTSKLENTSKYTDSELDSTKTLSSHTQHRKYSTTDINMSSTKPSPQLEKCRSIISKYKKINPDYSEKKVKLKPGSEKEKEFIENADKFVADVKLNQQSHNSQQKQDMDSKNAMEEIQAEKQQLHDLLNFTPQYQPKLNIPRSSKKKTLLYYEVKHGNKVLCSKVVKNEHFSGEDDKKKFALDANELKTHDVKIKVGPKLMLQSSDMKNTDQPVAPAVNEKFISPWLCWSDCVKLNAQRGKSKEVVADNILKTETHSAPDLALKKSDSILSTTIKNDNFVNKKIELQTREFSQMTAKEKLFDKQETSKVFSEQFDLNWAEIWNKSNGSMRADDISLKKNFDKNSVVPMNRFYSTNCTRGVLGPEATVMVKLKRLPKMNIREPPRICPEPPVSVCPPYEESCSDVQSKKLPKLIPKDCPPPPKMKMKDVPLFPPKCRFKPKDPIRKCSQEIFCGMIKRADADLRTLPKKLPKIVPRDCFPPLIEPEKTLPPLVRLKARPVIQEPRPCEQIIVDICSPRADEGLRVKRKKLPPLNLTKCSPLIKPQLVDGPPLKRLKKAKLAEPKRICIEVEDICPPRADDILGYQVKRKKLQTLLFSERYNNISWKEFNSKSIQSRNYATDSKCDMCCYSDKAIHPDINHENETTPSEWDKFEGEIFTGTDGQVHTRLLPKEEVDTSTGTELKVLKKHLGFSYWKEDNLHEKLLKSGFTASTSDSIRKPNSVTYVPNRKTHQPCDIPPEKTPLKDLKIKRLTKRRDFYKDFPKCERTRKVHIEDECVDPCTEPRMDEIMKYEVTAKTLPTLPKGKCLRLERAIPKSAPLKLRRLKKKYHYRDYDRPRTGTCEAICTGRADDNLVVKRKRLPPFIMSKCPRPVKTFGRDDNIKLKRLPKFKPVDEPRCPPSPCEDIKLSTRADKNLNLYGRKHLPIMKAGNCPCPELPDMDDKPKLRRLPPAPFDDRVDSCEIPCETVLKAQRSDANYEPKKKKLQTILRRSNKTICNTFCTLPDSLTYKQNFAQFSSSRNFSASSCLLQSSKKECKKLVSATPAKKKCTEKFKLPYCKDRAKNISCGKLKAKRPPCTRRKTPYPSFSECKDHEVSGVLTECEDNNRHLQPRYPILNKIVHLEPPPPHQGKIDPALEEKCIAKKLNIELEGDTRTCETFNEPKKRRLTKEMYEEVMKNPPYDPSECANEAEHETSELSSSSKGPCKKQDLSVCIPPEIECTLPGQAESTMECHNDKKDKETDSTTAVSKEKQSKLTCEKITAKDICEDVEDISSEPAKVENVCREHKKVENVGSEPNKGEKNKKDGVQIVEVDCSKVEKSKTKITCEPVKLKPKEDKKDDKSSTAKDKKDHCRNVIACKKKQKKAFPKKCSDLLKEDKPEKKKTKKMAKLCKKKPCTPKSKRLRKSSSCPTFPSPPKSFIDKILDFFRAKPNCPPPDQWKKDKLRQKAEKAAAAAGYELCEKKKPKIYKVTCKKTGVKSSKGSNSHNKKGKADGDNCKRFKSTYATAPAIQDIREESTSAYADKKRKKSNHKKCRLPKQKFCKPRVYRSNRDDCAELRPSCTPVQTPYASFSECKKHEQDDSVSECTEQAKTVRRMATDFDPFKNLGKRQHSTFTEQKRYYASSRDDDSFFSFLNISGESTKDMENKELAVRILNIVKESMKSIALIEQGNLNETHKYYNIFKELESLCEKELKRDFAKGFFDSENKHLKRRDCLSNICSEKSLLSYNSPLDTEETLMMDAIKHFCKTICSMPELSAKSYEESERIKTEKLQKQLDEILDNYKT